MPDLAAALRAVLPPGVVLGHGVVAPLWPGEEVPRAVPARQVEFAQGRDAARDAMRRLGAPLASVPMLADRSPGWPAGVTGSISHCRDACFAVLGWRAHHAGLGLDLEPAVPLDREIWPVILRDEEMRSPDPLAIFVAKEAAYKAQYAVTGAVFDFHTLAVALSGDRFTATFRQAVGAFAKGSTLHGRLVRTDRHTAAICAITAS